MLPTILAAVLTAAQPAPCPLTLPKEALDVRAPPGWIGHAPSLMRLTGYGMMAGPPASMTYLVPSGSRKMKGGAATSWQFAGGDEKWMYCTYDSSSTIQISRRLQDSAKVCELSHVRDAYGSIGKMRVTCR